MEWQFEVEDGKYKRLEGVKENNWVWSPTGIIDMHRPEKWGYVQFSTAPVAKVKFKLDPAAPARDLLQEIYYAERDYHEKHGRHTSSLNELGLAKARCPRLSGTPKLQITSDGFWATAEIRLRGKENQRWHIRQDAKVWTE